MRRIDQTLSKTLVVQSISMVTTQPKLIANGRAVKVLEGTRVHLTYLVFYNQASRKSIKG